MSTQDPAHPFGTCGCARSEHETRHEPDRTSEINAKVDAAYLRLADAIHGWRVTA